MNRTLENILALIFTLFCIFCIVGIVITVPKRIKILTYFKTVNNRCLQNEPESPHKVVYCRTELAFDKYYEITKEEE